MLFQPEACKEQFICRIVCKQFNTVKKLKIQRYCLSQYTMYFSGRKNCDENETDISSEEEEENYETNTNLYNLDISVDTELVILACDE